MTKDAKYPKSYGMELYKETLFDPDLNKKNERTNIEQEKELFKWMYFIFVSVAIILLIGVWYFANKYYSCAGII